MLVFLALRAPIGEDENRLFVEDQDGEADGGGAVLVGAGPADIDDVLAVQLVFRIFLRVRIDLDALIVEELGSIVDDAVHLLRRGEIDGEVDRAVIRGAFQARVGFVGLPAARHVQRCDRTVGRDVPLLGIGGGHEEKRSRSRDDQLFHELDPSGMMQRESTRDS